MKTYLYRVAVEQYSESLLDKIKENPEVSINEVDEITILCTAGGHDYFLHEKSGDEALKKVLALEEGVLPCQKKEG